MPIPEGSYKASDVRLVQCTLVSSTGTSVGLLELIIELNIFEDLFSSTMAGNILLNDSLNLINTLPLIGMEYLLITFEKPGSNLQFKKTFRIYKLTDRQRTTEQNESYLLHFASEELLLSESLLISRAYTDQPISMMINDIVRNYLKISPQKCPPAALRSTLGLHSLIIPGWKPFYAINFLARYALSQYKAASFVFYEDRESFRFISLEELSQQKSIQSVTVSPKNAGFERDEKADLQLQQEGAESISYLESCDTLRNIYSGTYAGLLITVDPLRQRIDTITYNGTQSFNQSKHTNPAPLISNAQDRLTRSHAQHYESFKKTVITSLGHDSMLYAQNKTLLRPHRIEEWMIPRQQYLMGIHSHRIAVSIPGSIALKVGSMLDVRLPAYTEQSKGGKTLDALYSGRYMITALRHKITKKSYACIAELSKDSVQESLPLSAEKDLLKQLKRQ